MGRRRPRRGDGGALQRRGPIRDPLPVILVVCEGKVTEPEYVEAFRVAPEYDFTQPPHPGVLFYEQFKIGMTWREWRAHADAALPEPAIA